VVKPDTKQAYWDDIADRFGQSGAQELWRRHSDRVNKRLLDAWLPRSPTGIVLKTDLFDEAVSEGLYPFLAQRFTQVRGVDISKRAVQAASRKYPALEADCADLRALPFTEPTFDCVVSNSSLDHFTEMSDVHQAMRELFRVIRPGGLLSITMDNLQNPMVWLRNHLPQRLLQKVGLIPYFVGETLTRGGLARGLEQAGFEVTNTTAVMHCPRAVAVARCAKLQQLGDIDRQSRYLNKLGRWERLEHWPGRYFTGHFVAARARRPA
jgi:SAM-dependent methyltransferase